MKLGGWKERDEGKTKGREEEGSGRRGRGGGAGEREREVVREQARVFFFCDKSDGTLPRPAPARGAQTYA